MVFFNIIFLSVFTFANSFFENISNLTTYKKISILEKRIDFICTRGVDLQLAETVDEYLKIKKQIDSKKLEILKKCIFSDSEKVITPFYKSIFNEEGNSASNILSKKMFRAYLISNIDADDAYYFLKFKKEITAIFSEESKKINERDAIFQKSIFWGINSVAKQILDNADLKFKNKKGNFFWQCVFLKYQGQFDQSLDCFKKSDIGLSKMFYYLTNYAKTKNLVKFSTIEKDVNQIRKSKVQTQLKLVNEAIVAVVTGKKENIEKSVFNEYLALDKRSQWYDYIVLTLTRETNLLSTDQIKRLTTDLEKSISGTYFLGLINDPRELSSLSFFQENSYQALLNQANSETNSN